MGIDLKPGQAIRRTDLHARYGGRRQGGISPSKQSNNVFVITAPGRGEQHGYLYDGQNADGFYHYTGEGQFGDQRMVQGNRAIRDHVAEGRELHLFEAQGPELRYIGQFDYFDDHSAEAPETNEGQPRKVIVFRLKQVSGVDPAPSKSPLRWLSQEPVVEVPVEQHTTEFMLIEGGRAPYEAERREQKLVLSFLESLERQGHDVYRYQLLPPGEFAPLYCDLFDKTTNTLYEAKGSVARPAIRMAVGQLADYARFIPSPPRKALLVPECPRPDLLTLLEQENISVTWPEGSGFASTESQA
jgi:hypothetical protein